VTWSGLIPDGRIEYITNQQFADHLFEMHNRLMVGSPGQIDIWPLRAAQLAGTASSEEERAKKIRAIRYLDADGVTRGMANYTVSGGDDDFVAHTLDVHHIVTETPDAYAAIWRYLLEVPLVSKVKVEHQRTDEPVVWMITDMRAAKVTVWEHQYLRILDVKAVLEAREYFADGDVVFDVSDPHGYAAGRWHLQVRDGVGRVVPATDVSDVPTLELGVAELSALYLGELRPEALVRAGRVVETGDGGSVAAGLLGTETTPFLSIWY
jgi:hypothetical protein